MNSWKYSIVIPALVIFVMTFNTKIIAQTSDQSSESAANDQQNILKYVITKDTRDTQLDVIKNNLADKGTTISFKNIKRNSKNEIVGIKIKFAYRNTILTHAKNLSQAISPIEISMNPSTGDIHMWEQVSKLSQTFNLKTDANGQTSLEKNTEGKNSHQIIGYKINDQNVIIKDSIFYITNTTNKVNITRPEGEHPQLNLIKRERKARNPFKIAETSPLIILDGKEMPYDQLGTVETNAIASIMVLKDEKATKKYGEKGKNGVIVIVLKKEDGLKSNEEEVISVVESAYPQEHSISNNGEQPLYILDGKEITKKEMEVIDPSTFGNIQILKDKSATKECSKKGENGVVIITSKKKD